MPTSLRAIAEKASTTGPVRKRTVLKSPVRENCTPGSVRGRSGNWPTYLDGGITRVNTSIQSQTSSWQNYRCRRFWFFAIWLTYVPGVFALGYPLTKLFDSGIPIYILAGAWMVASIVSANYYSVI